MGLGIIGLGNLGTNMVRHLMEVGHQCVVYDIHSVSVQALANEEVVGSISIQDFVRNLSKPRALWMMVPASEIEATLSAIIPHLDREDVVIDGAGANHGENPAHTTELKAKGIHYVGIETNGVSARTESGRYRAGDPSLQYCDPVLPAVQPAANSAGEDEERRETTGAVMNGCPNGGTSGAGPAVNAVDNGIKGGLTAAYTDAMKILHRAHARLDVEDAAGETALGANHDHCDYGLNLADIAEVWRRSCMVSSWLLDLATKALLDSPGLDKFAVRVSDSVEGRWTVVSASHKSIQAPLITAALYERFGPHGEAGFADKVLSSLCFKYRID